MNFVQIISNLLVENWDKWQEARLMGPNTKELFRLVEDFVDVIGFCMKDLWDTYQVNSLDDPDVRFLDHVAGLSEKLACKWDSESESRHFWPWCGSKKVSAFAITSGGGKARRVLTTQHPGPLQPSECTTGRVAKLAHPSCGFSTCSADKGGGASGARSPASPWLPSRKRMALRSKPRASRAWEGSPGQKRAQAPSPSDMAHSHCISSSRCR
ncbi:hypothetical protein CB1_000347001 [Camelus ferus]|nr:hypothetical protein CB1_000347001 [Camelus ferus]